MTKEEILNFIEQTRRFTIFCEKKFIEYAKIHNIDNAERYSFEKVENGDVYFSWYETWAYGGYEDHLETMPVEFLYS